MKTLKRIRNAFIIFGVIAFIFTAAAVLGVPQKGAEWLATAPYSDDCDFIVLLPGGGVPSGATLVRAYVAAEQFKKNPKAKIIISHKTEPPVETSTIWAIRNELVIRGVPGDSILLEKKARKTSEHAKYIKEQGLGNPSQDKYLIVTSPTHIKRSILTFSAAGFKNIYAMPAEDIGAKEDLGMGTFLRYGIWGSLKLGIDVIREFIAIGFYKLTGKA